MMSHLNVGVSLCHGSHLFHDNVWNEVGDIEADLVSAHHAEVRAVTAGLDSDLCITFKKIFKKFITMFQLVDHWMSTNRSSTFLLICER